MDNKQPVNIFWFRRDLRLEDNAGLYHALKSSLPVIPIFIFDTDILTRLENKADARVTFIHNAITDLSNELKAYGSSLLVKHNSPLGAFKELIEEFTIHSVFTNNDYEPYATQRDSSVQNLLESKNIGFNSFKDHLIFEKNEILKADGKPYTVFSAYKRRWLEKLQPDFHLKPYPCFKYFDNFAKIPVSVIPTLAEIGFEKNNLEFPSKEFKSVLGTYKERRDFPAVEGTSKIGVHLRFGMISIRNAARTAIEVSSETWLSELIWRDFYALILWQFPYSAKACFKKDFDKIRWRNDENEFEAWCEGKTGYPMVDAGMRQLNQTGWMHNRVRMIVASFLCKHLLIDWRWGETYFAKKLLDYDQASNVGGWQWAAGTGNDAVPYFRVFNPDLQMKKFDKNLEYVRRWIPEFEDPVEYPRPIVEHTFARERAIKVYREALK